MKLCYTQQKSANRGPHKVNHRSYVGPVLPHNSVQPYVAPSPSSVSSVAVRLPWYVCFWNWFKSLFTK